MTTITQMLPPAPPSRCSGVTAVRGTRGTAAVCGTKHLGRSIDRPTTRPLSRSDTPEG